MPDNILPLSEVMGTNPLEDPDHRTKLIVDRANDTTPEAHTEQLELSEKTGLPADVVGRNTDKIKRDLKVQDDMGALKEAPITRAKIDAKPDLAKAMGDDFRQVAALEKEVSGSQVTWDATKHAWNRSSMNIEINDLTWKEMNGGLSAEEIARRDSLEDQVQNLPDLDDKLPWIGNFPRYAAEFMPQLIESGFRATDEMAVGLVGGAAIGTAVPGVGTVVGGLAGTSAGARAGMTEFNFQQEAANAYREFSALTDDEGNQIDQDAARMAAIVYGYGSAGLEMLGVEQMLTRMPGVQGLTRRVITEAMGVPTVRMALVRASALWAQGAVVEGATEAAQALLQAGTQMGLTKVEFGTAQAPDDVGEQVSEGFKAGFYGGGGVTAPTTVAKTTIEIKQIRDQQKLAEDWDRAITAAENNQLRDRDPALHDEIVEEANPGATVWIEPERLTTYLQEAGITEEDFHRAAPKTAADLAEANEQGRTAQIDYAEWMRYFAPADKAREHLVPHLRKNSPDSLSLEEYAEVQKDQESLRAEYDAIMEQYSKADEGNNQVYDFVKDQLVNQGKENPSNASHMAAVQAAFFKTQGERIGVDPWALFQQMNISVQHDNMAEMGPGRSSIDRTDALLSRLRSGDIPGQKEMYGKSLVQFLIDKGGILDEGGELSARDLHNPLIEYGGRKLSRPQGVSLETAYEYARDEGYVPAEIPSNELLDYIDKEIKQGQPLYTQGGENAQAVNLAMELEELSQTLIDHDMSLADLTNAQIKKRLETQTLYKVEMSDLTAKEKRIVQKQLKKTDHPEKVKELLKEYDGTGWASQAIEAALAREAIELLIAGKPIDGFRSAFQGAPASVDNWKAAIIRDGYTGIKNAIMSTGIIGRPSKPGYAVNSSFLNCEPSKDCAKYCYATGGNYSYKQNIIRGELVTMLIENDPVWAGQAVAAEYKATPEFHLNKALRMYDKGDGSTRWLPFYKELEREGVRAQIFSKRPDFLRQVSDYHLRMVSLDKDNHALAESAMDLGWAYVYGGSQLEADFINAHPENISVVLPIKLGQKFVTKAQNNLIDGPIRKHICPVDRGKVSIAASVDVWDKDGNIVKRISLADGKKYQENLQKAEDAAKKIGGKTNRVKKQGWTCGDCDEDGGIGCFSGQATGALKKAQESGEVTKESLENIHAELAVLSRSDPGLAEKLAKELSVLIRQVAKGSYNKAEGVDVPKSKEAVVTDGASGADLEIIKTLFQAVYHGTHATDIARFTMDKINTGEGAQVYGWGMYFASRKGVAEWYRKTVSKRNYRATGVEVASELEARSDDDRTMVEGLRDAAKNWAYHHGVLRGAKFKKWMREESGEYADTFISGMGEAEGQQWFDDNFAQMKFVDDRTHYDGMPIGSFMARKGPTWGAARDFFDKWEDRVNRGTSWDVAKKLEVEHWEGEVEALANVQAEIEKKKEQLKILLEVEGKRIGKDAATELYWDDIDKQVSRSITNKALIDRAQLSLDWIRTFEPNKLKEGTRTKGQLYVVDVPNADEVLYRDAPMEEQSPVVIARLRAAGLLPEVSDKDGTLSTGEFETELDKWDPLIEALSDNIGEGQQKASTIESVRLIKKSYADVREQYLNKDSVDMGDWGRTVENILMDYGMVDRDWADPTVFHALEKLIGEQEDFYDPDNQGVWEQSGADFYNALGRTNTDMDPDGPMSDDKFASMELLKAGIPGLRYDDFTRGRGESQTQNYVIWSEDSIEIVDALYQAYKDGEYQGKMEMPEGKEFFKITLTEKADLSTYLHESGHVFLEVLNQINERYPNEDTRKDLGIILEWMGLVSFDQIEVVHHERFAGAFEEYLMEGKAPSLELRDAFARFKLWLKRIYSTVTKLINRAGGPGLSDEVRGVFDRMLASEAQIKEAENTEGLVPLFTNAGDMGVSESEYADYTTEYSKGHAAAVNDLEAKVLRELNKQRQSEFKARRKEIREEVTEVIDNAPAQVAKYFLRNGEFRDGTPVPADLEGKKLNTQAVLDLIPDSAVLRKLAFLHNKQGLHPDIFADQFGFDSGDQFLEALQMVKPRAQLIKEQTEARMRKEFPSMMDDGTLAEEAIASLHNDQISTFLLTELKALNKKTDKPRSTTPLAVIKQASRDAVAAIKLKDLQPEKFRQAELRNGRLAIEATAGKDFVKAREYKRRQLQAHWMFREAVKTQAEFGKIRKRMVEYTKPKVRARIGKASVGFLDAIDAILEGTDFRKISNTVIRKRESLNAWITDQEAQGQTVIIPDHLRNEAGLKSYRDMTLPELQEVQDAVLHIAHLAQFKSRLVANAARRSLDKAAGELITNLQQAYPTPKAVNASPRKNAFTKAMELLNSWHAQLLKAEFIARWMDDGKPSGLAHQLIFLPIRQAQVDSLDMQKEYNGKILALFKGATVADKLRMGRKVHFQGMDFSVRDLYTIALNLGNDGNKFKLLEGYKTRGWTEQNVMALLEKHLQRSDWERVQSMWEIVNSLWPQIRDLHQRNTGIAPPKVNNTPFQVNLADGTTMSMPGGYYPVVYDRRQNYRAEQNAQKKDSGNLFEGNFMKPGGSISKGFTETRKEKYFAPILLDFNVMGNHISETIHFITHFDAVTNVDKLLNHPGLREAIIDRMGQDVYNQLRPWLQHVANDGKMDYGSNGMDFFDQMSDHVRSGATVAAMGLSLTTPLMQLLGITNIAAEVGPVATVRGMASLLVNFPASFKEIMEESREYRHLMQTFDRDVKNNIQRNMSLNPVKRSRDFLVHNAAFGLIGLFQGLVSAIAWRAAYDKGVREGMNHQAAVTYGDAVMVQTQSGGAAKDLAKSQRGGPVKKMFAMFYTFFSSLYSNLSDMNRNFKGLDPRSPDMAKAYKAMVQAGFLLFLPVMIEKLVRVGGLDPDNEDLDTWPEWFWELMTKDIPLYAATTLPLVRDIVSGVFSDYGYSMAPTGQIVGNSVRIISQRVEHAADEEADEPFEWDEIKLTAAFDLATIITKIPFAKPVDYYIRVKDIKEEESETPKRDFLFGPPRD